MKYLYHITFFIVFFQFTVQAQSNFKPGYIINAKGDTIKGLLDYRQWSKNPDQIIFKKDAAAPETSYTKETTPAFGVEGYGNFHLFSVKSRQYTSAPGDEIAFADTTYINKNIYLNEIVLGKKVNLYMYDDGHKTQFFISEGNLSLQELTGYRQINYDSFSKIEPVDTYKKQLSQLADLNQPGNNSITRQIELAEYKVSDVKEIIIAINGNNDVKYVEKLRKKSRFFVGAGLNANAIKFTGEKHVYHSLGNVWSYLPKINAGMDLFTDKDAKLMFRGELNLAATQSEFSYTNTLFTGTAGETTHYYKTNFTRVTISLNPQIVYNVYNKSKVKVFIAGGPMMNLSVYPTNKLSITSVGPGRVTAVGIDFPVSPVNFILTAKAGITLDKFQVYGAYVSPFSIYNYSFYSRIVNTSYNFGINYFLGK